MHEIIAKRPVGRPKGSTMGIMERIERFKITEKCAEATDEIIELWRGMVKNTECPWILRLAAADRLMNRAFGLPVRPIEVDTNTTETQLKKIIHEFRWMPPDPNDRSVETIPEPD
jgi:hypothetical protein